MEEKIRQSYLAILKEELIPALGCTEPIAIAYAAAAAAETLGCPRTFPDGHMDVYCSGNIIKNVRSVTVPNSGGLRGIEAAAVLGAVGGEAGRNLEVLENITESDRQVTERLLRENFCSCFLEKGTANLYIRVELSSGGHSAVAAIRDRHTNIVQIRKDGRILFEKKTEEIPAQKKQEDPRRMLNVADILTFAGEVEISEIREVIGRQIALNTAISEEGLRNPYGAEVGRTLIRAYGTDVKVRARARAAAGSDARMNGCSLPVVINSGSGNQGMTCSLPVIEYAKELKIPEEQLYRALVISNLVAIHQKAYIGSLSAYCGAVSAACGAGAAITWLLGGDYEAVAKTITNTLANTGGIVCDGAKSSCAAKIASAVDAAILACSLEQEDHCFMPGEGLVCGNVEDTIKNMGYVGRVGMRDTDVTILNLMLHPEQKQA